jgi:isopentenyl-diphosphate delta-isomerase
MEERIILVDQNDREIGSEEKLKAHSNGAKLHRAFSIFVFNSKGETMLQKRAMTKYHSPGLWTNTCCSHPNYGESIIGAAHRKLRQEMGFDCDMDERFSFTYKAEVGNGLTEWEYDHVLFGRYDKDPMLNPEEAEEWKWISLDDLKKDAERNPKAYTAWLRIIIDRIIDERKKG